MIGKTVKIVGLVNCPVMTVTRYADEERNYICTWFDWVAGNFKQIEVSKEALHEVSRQAQ